MEKLERPQCCIDRCLTKTKSIKVKDIIYYLFPTDTDWANKWETKIKDFDPKYKRRSNDIVCSLHFAKSSMLPVSRQLVDHALPIYFPQKAAAVQRTKLPAEQTVSGQPKTAKPPVPDSTSVDSKCCISGCPTKFNETEPKIRGFKFPESDEQRRKWIYFIELYNSQKSIEWNKSMRVCELHFTSACFTNDGKLDDHAKPTIFKSAIECRQKEIAKKQTQSTVQQASPTKAQSINVPLHKQNANNHSMTQRGGPVVSRRLSLPYSKLPPLLPKPNVLKRPNPMQVTSVNVPKKLQRISLPNGTLTPVTITNATTFTNPNSNATVKRPVPGLTKVNVVSNAQLVPQGNVSILRKTMPAPQINKLQQSIVARLDNGTAKLIPITTTGAAHITRLPPTLKPAPRPVIKGILKGTYVETKMPKISRVQSMGKVPSKEQNTPPPLSKAPESIAAVSSQVVVAERRVPDVIVIEDEEAEMAKAMKTSDDTEDASATITNKNGDEMQLYTVKDECAFKFPRMLLARIIEKKRQNDELSTELTKWKKMAIKMNQQYRLQRATTSSETIDIS